MFDTSHNFWTSKLVFTETPVKAMHERMFETCYQVHQYWKRTVEYKLVWLPLI
jgi:hypothetical protein